MKLRWMFVALGLIVSAWLAPVVASEPLLRDGDYVAIIGDSITNQCRYSVFIEDYLLMCKPAARLTATELGRGGETAGGFLGRMENDTLRLKPTVATTCYGMNDGGYGPMDPGKGQGYRASQKAVVERLKKAGITRIVVGSPGCVDADTYRGDPGQAAMYNKTLAELSKIAKDVAREEGVAFANVHDPMMATMTKAKAKYGPKYHVGGAHGIHPERNGHLVMAYAFLKALGCDGHIGTITVDMKTGRARATKGHKVLSCKDGTVELESTKYPFCFFGDPASPESTRGVLEFLPFNEELNRFQLVVHGLPGEKAKVTWGTTSREFTTAELAKGINLAAAFLDNPFCEAFTKVEAKISQQQGHESWALRDLLYTIPQYKAVVPSETEKLEQIADALVKQNKQNRLAAAASVTPVRHTLKIEPVNE